MIKVAITGNIASGKTCVEKIISDAGYTVLDADKINHNILINNKNIINKIKETFKDFDITIEDGSLSREKIGKIVFENNEKKKQLEKILFKEISKEIDILFKENKDKPIIFVSAAMLFESGFYKDYDKIIFVSADEKIRTERLIKRNNYTMEYAIKRITAQDKEDYKIKLSDYIIYNNSDFNSLKIQTTKVLQELSNLL